MYEPLLKLFYQDKTLYEEEYNKRINSEDAVYIDFYINNYQAFYIENREILKTIIDIQKTEKNIQNLVAYLPGLSISQFKKRCLIDEIVLSNKIEGVHSTRREIDNVIDNINSNSIKRFKGLVKKYFLLFNEDIVKIDSPEDIREIYDELALPEIIKDDPENAPDGVLFRSGSVVVQSPTGKDIHTGLYPEDKIILSMQKALSVLKCNDIDELIKISIFHYLFGYIHPFYDGNGRTSRFISSYLLSQCLESIIGFRISYTIQQNIKKYYDAFKNCNDSRNRGDLTPFIIMFLEIIKESITQLYKALLSRANDFDYYSKSIKFLPQGTDKKYKDIYYLLVQASLFSEHGITIYELIDNAEISRSTVLKRLSEIKKYNILTEQKISTKKYFKLDLDKLKNYIK